MSQIGTTLSGYLEGLGKTARTIENYARRNPYEAISVAVGATAAGTSLLKLYSLLRNKNNNNRKILGTLYHLGGLAAGTLLIYLSLRDVKKTLDTQMNSEGN
ncbi:MAG: hypothetical protein QXY45_03405 [Candidatus Aenigmatarchaeota archaeon]